MVQILNSYTNETSDNPEIDSLSGIYNSNAFYKYARQWLNKNQNMDVSLVVFDVEHFKVYNDLFGLDEGDRLIRDIGIVLRQDVTNEFLCGRLYADRFAVLLSIDSKKIEEETKKYLNWFISYRNDYRLSVHFGAYAIKDRTLEISVMCDRALLALESIKNSSDIYFMWFEEKMRSQLLLEKQFEQDIRSGFEHDEFEAYFQPEYDHVNHVIIGAEALARWNHPQKGIIKPHQFISLMERTGSITRLDLFMFEKACEFIERVQEKGISVVPISINLSRRDIYAVNLCTKLCNIAQKHNVSRKMLHLEITEQSYMENSKQLIETISSMRKAGFVVEMDGFGSGYSSLNTLKNVPVDMLKLDLKSLVDNVEGKGGIILNSLVQMAHWLNLRVIAEGVETAKQADYLKTIECRYVQGYFYSKPLKEKDFVELLTKQKVKKLQRDITIAHFFDTKEFWDPDAQATVIFNTFVGAAGIFTYNGNTLLTSRVNDEFLKTTGLTRDDYDVRKNFLEYIMPEDKTKFVQAMNKARNADKDVIIESRWSFVSNHKYHWFRMRIRCIAKALKNYVLYFSFEDVTERVELSEANKKLYDELQGIIQSVPGGVTKVEMIDDKSRITYVSEGVCRMFGYTRNELIDNTWRDVFFGVHPEDLPNLKNCSRKSVKNIRGIDCQYRMRCKNGKYIWVDMKSNPVKSPNGNIIYYCSYTDITSLKNMEQQLLSEKEKTELVFENNMISVWDYDLKTKLCHWHYRMKEDFRLEVACMGNVPECIIEQGIICKDSISSYRKMYEAIESGQERIDKTIHFKSHDGVEMWQKISYRTLFENGIPIGAMGFSINVTENMEKEQRYQHEMQYLDQAQNDDLLGKGRANITRNIVESYVTKSGEVMTDTDLPYTELVENVIADAISVDDKTTLKNTLSIENLNKQYINLNKSFSIKYQYIKNREKIANWVELSIKIYQEPQTGDLKAFLYFYDINEKKYIDEVMNSIYDNSFSLIGILDVNTKLLHTLHSSQFEKDAGLQVDISYQKFLPIFIERYVVEECKEEAIKTLQISNILSRLKKEKRFNCAFSVIFNGELRRKKFEFSYLNHDKTKILYTRSDITELFLQQAEQRRRLNEALADARKANEAKTIFLSNMSHDIRTPLNAIINVTKLAYDDYKDNNSMVVLDDLNKIETSGKFLLGLINDILDMSHIESGKLTLHPEPYSYKEFINYINCIFEPLCEQKNIHFLWDKGKTSYTIMVDKVRFNQIFFNILSNAVKYTPEGGTIHFIVSDDTVVDKILYCNFRIKDNGCGMSKEFQNHMFEPFEREQKSANTHIGTGLGLAIVKNIVDLAGGTIRINSEINMGTEVLLRLKMPIADIQMTDTKIDTTSEIEKTGSSNEILKGKKILVVEDNKLNMLIMRRILEKQGVVVAEAYDGHEGIQMFTESKTDSFNVILMDVRMPNMDGLEATKVIRSLKRKDASTIPIIAMTANAFDEDKKQAKEAGMSDFLTKPINTDMLFITLKKYLNK